MLGMDVELLVMLSIPITPTSLVDVALETVPPHTPVPDTVCVVVPLRFNVPLAVELASVFIRPLLTKLPLTRNVLELVPANTFTKPPVSTVKSLDCNSVGVVPKVKVPATVKPTAACPAASTVTVWPAAITALSAGLGTEPPQVAAALQLPVATDVKVALA